MAERVIAGVDFSGAREVPNQTWLSLGRLDGLGLQIVDLRRVGSHALAGELISTGTLAAAGLDFPFSLPADFIRFLEEKAGRKPAQSWQEVVEQLILGGFEDFVTQVELFGKDSKRLTDAFYRRLAQSPLHRGGPSMVQMTYQGMRLLSSLDPARFSILPFESWRAGTCAVFEVFPRGMLWCLGLPDSGYKSKEKKDREKMLTVRRELLKKLIELREQGGERFRHFPRLTVAKELQHVAIDSDDALDAVIACYAAAVWVAAPELFLDPLDCDSEDVLLEGWIYAPVKSRAPDPVNK